MSKLLITFENLFIYAHPNRHVLKDRLGQESKSLGAAFVQNEREQGKSTGASRGNMYRLKRFGKAMMGTASWEVPGAVLNGQYSILMIFCRLVSDLFSPLYAGFDWSSLPPGSIIVDVGGGIGSTSMSLANEFIDNRLKFIIQDRPVVVEMGEKVIQILALYPLFPKCISWHRHGKHGALTF